jgi:ubiquitin carboxyl-terminal hydrolase 36/42
MKLFSFLNLGNTCYINSILQAFIYDSPELKDKIISENNLNNELETRVPNSLNEIIDISDFVTFFTKKYPQFRRFEQHDAHEFLLCFVDYLNSAELGKTRLDIKCESCKNTNIIYEEFVSIDLSIPDTNEIVSIYSLFQGYLGSELNNDEDNLYFCDKCNSFVCSRKNTFLWKLPKKLIIVLKRYTSCGKKISTKIEYPEKLKIRETSTDLIITYKLSCVVNHVGGLSDGHYNSFINILDNWYFMDDDICIPRALHKNNSYILFYSRE